MDNSYLSIAINDYDYLQATRSFPHYNNIAVNCQQVCEKLLKAVIEKVNPNASSELQTHNLKRLYDRVSEYITISREYELALSTISDFYKDARHPGDDFVNVSKKDVELCLDVTDELYGVVTEWFRSRYTQVHTQVHTADVLINIAKDINTSG